MRVSLVLLTAFALASFAGNSLLCRAALKSGAIDPASFTLLRVTAGAAALLAWAAWPKTRGDAPLAAHGSWPAAACLFGYAALFSEAYRMIDAGVGALLLFAAVQVTMIGASLRVGLRPKPRQWAGLALAVGGLAALMLPGKAVPEPTGALMMLAAGLCWGGYCLYGRSAVAPTTATAANFVRALPMAAVLGMIQRRGAHLSAAGLGLAVASGALTSGAGYAAWYAVVPRLGPLRASALQLLVPVLALAASTLLLDEVPRPETIVPALVILGGVLLFISASAAGAARASDPGMPSESSPPR